MTSYPEFDPLHAPEDPPALDAHALDLPPPFEDEEEPPQLEGMIFCSFLSPEDLNGSNWEGAPPLPELPPTLWDEAPLPEAAVLRAMAEARFGALPAAPPILEPVPEPIPAPSPAPIPESLSSPFPASILESPGAAFPAQHRAEPRSRGSQKFAAPFARPAAESPSSLYGNLADTSWLEVERLRSGSGIPEIVPEIAPPQSIAPAPLAEELPHSPLTAVDAVAESVVAAPAIPELAPKPVAADEPAPVDVTDGLASDLRGGNLPESIVPSAIGQAATAPPLGRPRRHLRTRRWTSLYTSPPRATALDAEPAPPLVEPDQPAEVDAVSAPASDLPAANPPEAVLLPQNEPELAAGPDETPATELLPEAAPGVHALVDADEFPAADLPPAHQPGPAAAAAATPSAPAAHTPAEEKLGVLEAPPLTAEDDDKTNDAGKTPVLIGMPAPPPPLPLIDKELSVLEAPQPQAELATTTRADNTPTAGEEPFEAPTGSPVPPLTPRLQEGLIEILAFQPPQFAIATVERTVAPAVEPHRPLFQTFYTPVHEPPMQIRVPHFGHLAALVLLVFTGLVGSTYLTRGALHFHLFGVTTAEKAATDIHYTIGFMAGIYFITFALAAMVFPLWWRRSLFSGLQWNAAGAGRKILPLLGAAVVCFVLALVDQIVLPGPTNAPIDKMFDSTTAAWLLLIFGVTFAPFFEEIVFRGFLLPALCTAFDWYGEKLNGNPPTPPDANGHPQWSMLAMTLASICTSIPFAGMHAEQTGYSIGPFVLLVAVSMMLCWARLRTRSLAASVIVHATYNGLLFGIMLLGTGGFRHLDKM